MFPDIDAHQVDQAEGGRFGVAHQRPGDGIHFIHGVTIFQDVIQGEGAGAKRQTVADEVGRILAQHNPFAQAVFAKLGDELRHVRQCLGGGDDFQQL